VTPHALTQRRHVLFTPKPLITAQARARIGRVEPGRLAAAPAGGGTPLGVLPSV